MIVFVKDSSVNFATFRVLGMTLVPWISHSTSLPVIRLSSDNYKKNNEINNLLVLVRAWIMDVTFGFPAIEVAQGTVGFWKWRYGLVCT